MDLEKGQAAVLEPVEELAWIAEERQEFGDVLIDTASEARLMGRVFDTITSKLTKEKLLGSEPVSERLIGLIERTILPVIGEASYVVMDADDFVAYLEARLDISREAFIRRNMDEQSYHRHVAELMAVKVREAACDPFCGRA